MTAQRPKIQLNWNEPVEIRLRYNVGKPMEDRGYGPSVMYTTVRDEVLFVDLATSTKISQLRLSAGESFMISKQKRGRETHTVVWLTPETEKDRAKAEMESEPPSKLTEQMNGTLANIGEGKPPAAPRPMPVARELGTGTNGPAPQRQAAVPIKATYGAAMQEFLLLAGRATKEAERGAWCGGWKREVR